MNRQVIADAISNVEGVSCSMYSRQTNNPGDAYVRVSRFDYPDKFGAVITWQIVVYLPKAVADAERWVESRIVDIELNLTSIAFRMNSASLYADTQNAPYLLIEGN